MAYLAAYGVQAAARTSILACFRRDRERICASVAYVSEKTSRMRFLEAALLRELVARDA